MKNLSKKILIASLAAVTAASVLAGCGGEKGGSGSAKGDTIKIGTDLEMTGNQAAYGMDALHGAQLAVEEINKAGGVLGKKLELVLWIISQSLRKQLRRRRSWSMRALLPWWRRI